MAVKLNEAAARAVTVRITIIIALMSAAFDDVLIVYFFVKAAFFPAAGLTDFVFDLMDFFV